MQESIDIIKSVFKVRKSQYSTARFRYATVREQDKQYFIQGVLDFVKETDIADEIRNYSKIQFYVKALKPEEGIEIFEKIVNGQSVFGVTLAASRDYSIEIFNRWDDDLPLKSFDNGLNNEWPGTAYIYYTKQYSHRVPHGPLLKPDLPYFPSSNEALKSWTGIDPQWNSDLRHGIVINLPDYKARILEISIGETSTKIKIDTAMKLDELILKIGAYYNGSFIELTPIRTEEGFEVTTADGFPTIFDFYLLDKKKEDVIDWQRIHLKGYGLYPKNIKFDFPERQLGYLIDQGETESVEFKEKVGNGQELAESVLAFANTQGGVILVGIKDDTTVCGVDEPEKEIGRIVNLLDKRCEPVPQIKTSKIQYQDETIIVIEIPIGDNPPYYDKYRGKAYVRVHATDRPMKRVEMDAMYKS